MQDSGPILNYRDAFSCFFSVGFYTKPKYRSYMGATTKKIFVVHGRVWGSELVARRDLAAKIVPGVNMQDPQT